MVDLDQPEVKMKSILTQDERYSIISQWVANGPVSYYNLVRQTEMAILQKQSNRTILSRIKNALFKRKKYE